MREDTDALALFNWVLGAESREWQSGSSLRGGRQEGSVLLLLEKAQGLQKPKTLHGSERACIESNLLSPKGRCSFFLRFMWDYTNCKSIGRMLWRS